MPENSLSQNAPVQIASEVSWVDRICGTAAVDPIYRSLLIAMPKSILANEPLPSGVLKQILAYNPAPTNLREFAQLAIKISTSNEKKVAQ